MFIRSSEPDPRQHDEGCSAPERCRRHSLPHCDSNSVSRSPRPRYRGDTSIGSSLSGPLHPTLPSPGRTEPEGPYRTVCRLSPAANRVKVTRVGRPARDHTICGRTFRRPESQTHSISSESWYRDRERACCNHGISASPVVLQSNVQSASPASLKGPCGGWSENPSRYIS